MTSRRVEDFAPQIRSIFVLGSPSGLTDGQLLDRFATGVGPESSLAFEALVERHGPMVLRVCRGVLGDPHDAQDAFQATFLVLIRKAGSIRDRGSLASWLHGVALRVASHAKGADARRRRREREKAERAVFESVMETEAEMEADDDLGPRLHEEVGRLPERYRAAVVLCYLEGHTCEDAARVLRWPVGTVKSRLSRAKQRLRGRLTRLGLAPASALERPPGALAIAPLSPRLTQATAEAAARFGARSSPSASALGAVALAKGVLKAMTLAKLKWTAMGLMAGAAWLGISSASTPSAPAQEPPRQKKADRPKAVEADPAPIPAPDPLALTLPRDLSAKAGSGTILMYALDRDGNRIVDDRAMKTIEAKVAGKKGSKDLIAAAAAGPWKEVDVDVRWVAITGILDNRAVREAAARAGKIELDRAYPDYKRVEVQRQVRGPEGTWSDWTDINYRKNYEVLDHLPELTPERTPEEVRPPALVDPLPILKKGTWSGVDPEAVLNLKLPPGEPVQAPINEKPKYGSPVLSIRFLDFTVEPGTTCRYRVRIVVANPRTDEEPRRKDLFGPWSEPTGAVSVP